MAPEAQQGYWPSNAGYNAPQGDIITPGADNFSEAASGELAGNAYGVAEQNSRESGLEAMRSPNYPQQAYQSQQAYGRGNDAYDPQTTQQQLRPAPITYTGGNADDRNSYSSVQGLNTAAVPMAESSPRYRSRSPGYATAAYTDDPYQGYSVNSLQNLGTVQPDEIYDDGDDGLDYGRRGVRTSMLSLGQSNSRGGHNGGAAAAGGVAAGAGVMGALGGLVGRSPGNRDGSGQYDAVQNGANTAYQGAGGSTGDLYDVPGAEKSAWLAKQGASSKRWKWTIIGAIALILAAAIALGVYFGIVRNKHGSGTSGESAADDTSSNGDLNINSPEIKKLLNNVNLHKVFPGIDYTPINTQYPDCLHNPPSQNNVTRDLAVLSQLTNTIRLYGTDCNQTEMLIHATNQLQMNDTIKIWLGVWQDGNKTTNARQLSQMWDILDKYGDSPFKGVIVANEILFRKQMTATELGNLLSEVRTNITNKGMSLPVATSDLGDDWSSDLAEMSDYIMANIHPFFGGVNAKDAASWTYSFWENNNGQFFKSDKSKNIIAETGWPSQGGTDCGTTDVTDCPDASVAGINELNQFMSDWVCQALTNGTQYFWFESFDEPWKIMYDEGDQNWEDHWGVMDVNRNLKKGVTIPDCDGKTVD
ncbi:putative glucan endo-1,3-beta-glucosidase btgC [Cytospora mali]|uniref:glucan endo-1,3-beta-D-glucosidase n=1 Tax=Cytospora mali TaxID=578113 RepID=A0A194UR59_CYTMA|nr:putative glucan endo-1,3-beta-glucosidase btgC [Valsa mali var. pyri (nom. inval.)]